MKINGNEIKPGMVIKHQETLWTAVKADHVKPGKGGAFAQVELKNILDGRKLNERFRSADKVERVRLDQRDYQYLYAEGEMLVFMNTESYEQISLHIDFVGEERAAYLTDGMMVVVELYEDKPIGVELPQHVELEVIDTEPVVKGQTAANSYKPAILSGNIRSAVPPFVGVGERVIVATEDGSYVRRAEMGSF
ncbi:elongation factor P [Glycocaulis alkaliphilus]|uniref:Elongation factor P n=1 Tax=Glycocaulis alkaliphilus TaxID=1434191 RepID=A0A3T0ECZ6_9PROT|nr:elongation factor P [Glycocaulis alkaliphilus]AZU05160.1 elongation factor P [Glycocaulis alkaliphilus]GGB64767.1 elongation factor P [Glycocaulis alkaliphilus]